MAIVSYGRRSRIAKCGMAAIRFLCGLSILILELANAVAQPSFAQSQASYGGQLVQELVPYQPNVVFSSPPQETKTTITMMAPMCVNFFMGFARKHERFFIILFKSRSDREA